MENPGFHRGQGEKRRNMKRCWRFGITVMFILILVNCYQAVMEISPNRPYDIADNDEGENEELNVTILPWVKIEKC